MFTDGIEPPTMSFLDSHSNKLSYVNIISNIIKHHSHIIILN